MTEMSAVVEAGALGFFLLGFSRYENCFKDISQADSEGAGAQEAEEVFRENCGGDGVGGKEQYEGGDFYRVEYAVSRAQEQGQYE